MDMEKFLKFLVFIIGTSFAVFFFLDSRHVLQTEAEQETTELRQRILMSESTRYAEIAKYYTDKMKAGETLTEAEKARLDLVQEQQVRINETLSKDE